MRQIVDLSGIKFGKLTAISQGVRSKTNRVTWNCNCDCGKSITVVGNNLHSGNTKSCGCSTTEMIRASNTTHGGRYERLNVIFHGMRQRCYNPKRQNYKWYGGRGIAVCDEWDDYVNFRTWALDNGYKDNLTIDRLDGDKNYEPNNCQWITQSENTAKANKERWVRDGRDN